MNDLAVVFVLVFTLDKLLTMRSMESIDEACWNQIESRSFWCLCRIIEGVQDHYTRDQPGIQKKQFLLKSLVDRIDRKS
jgi:hypothetical protein